MIALYLAKAGVFFGSWLGRAVLFGGVLLGLIAWRQADKAELRAEGREEVVQASKAAGADANAKNEKVRAAARAPGAADRLRADRSTCRDC